MSASVNKIVVGSCSSFFRWFDRAFNTDKPAVPKFSKGTTTRRAIRLVKRYLARSGWVVFEPWPWQDIWIRARKEQVYINLTVMDKDVRSWTTTITDIHQLSTEMDIPIGIFSLIAPPGDACLQAAELGICILGPENLEHVDEIVEVSRNLRARHAASTFSGSNAEALAEAESDTSDQMPLTAEADERLSSPDTYLQRGRELIMHARFDEADRVLQEGLRSCSDQFLLRFEAAWVAHHKQDWPEALSRWRTMNSQFPEYPAGLIGIVQTLLEMKRHTEAEAEVSRADPRFANDANFALTIAQLAMAREDWPEAYSRWEAAGKLTKLDAFHLRDQGIAQWHMQLADVEHCEPQSVGIKDADSDFVTSAAASQVDDVDDRTLVLGFESLGQNCEFGLFQRHFGAEPLGLLRWVAIDPEALIGLLNSRFHELREPGNFTLKRSDWGEYALVSSAPEVIFHTWITESVAEPDVLREKQLARLVVLRRKMLTELEKSSKIYVYKACFTLSDDQAAQIANALQAFGKHTFLCVREASHPWQVATVSRVSNTMLLGYISRSNPVDGLWNISFQEWLSICRQARRLRRDEQSQ